jgi:hypothetical protein
MARIVSINEILAERASNGYEIEHAELTRPISEMITTADGLMDLVEKVRVDVEEGQAEVPLLYTPLWRRVPGPFPGRAVDIGENTLQANVVFLEKLETGEIQFGVMQKGVPKTAILRTYAAGFQWDEDITEWDATWKMEMVNTAFGRAYNYLLNHLHLSPIFAPPVAYTAANQTSADTTAGASLSQKTLLTFQAAYQAGIEARPQRPWTWLLASEMDRFQIEAALLEPVLDTQGNQMARVPITGIIYYDGAEVDMQTELVVYPGVTPKKCYGVRPQQRLLELVHHDLRIDAGNSDISRLIEAQVVGRSRRGIYAEVENSVEEILLP